MIKKSRLLIVLTALIISLSSCSSNEKDSILSISGKTMGTSYKVKIVTKELPKEKIDEIRDHILQTLDELNHQINHYDIDSEISKFNILDEATPFLIGKDFSNIIEKSFWLYEEADGLFDITIGPLVKLWGFGPSSTPRSKPPTDAEVQKILKNIGQDNLVFNADHRTLTKNNTNIEINLSAIAKGYAVDRISDILLDLGYKNFLVEIGGEIYAKGFSINKSPWSIGINHPDISTQEFIKKVLLSDLALATSGNYQNKFDFNNVTYSHILNPKTGKSQPSKMLSVSILAAECAIADGVATAAFNMTPNKVIEWINRMDGVEGYVVYSDGDNVAELTSRGFNQYMLKD